jgi:hypothetical protein
MFGTLTDALVHRWRHESPASALSRAQLAVRHLKTLLMLRPLFANAAYRHHMRSFDDRSGPLFFLDDQYLARGLSPHVRAFAALSHYRHEVQAFNGDYFDVVYRQHGLLLWQVRAKDDLFDILLVPGADVRHEGSASVIARFNATRICTLSYSTVPLRTVVPDAASNEHGPCLPSQFQQGVQPQHARALLLRRAERHRPGAGLSPRSGHRAKCTCAVDFLA